MKPLRDLIDTPLSQKETGEIENGPWWSGHPVSPEIVRLVMTCRALRQTLFDAKIKLQLYRLARGEYVGGLEYGQLIKKIDNALK